MCLVLLQLVFTPLHSAGLSAELLCRLAGQTPHGEKKHGLPRNRVAAAERHTLFREGLDTWEALS